MVSARLGVEWLPLASLFCSPANPRHNDEAVPHVAASLRRFGWQQPIVAMTCPPADRVQNWHTMTPGNFAMSTNLPRTTCLGDDGRWLDASGSPKGSDASRTARLATLVHSGVEAVLERPSRCPPTSGATIAIPMTAPPLPRVASAEAHTSIELTITVEDREMIADLEAFREGPERSTFVLNALRIGLLALKQARGRIDADTVKVEGEKIIASLAGALKQHDELLTRGVKETLSNYFDPGSGKFSERVEQLLKKDGDLEVALKRQVDGESSELGRTLASSVGKDSPLLRMLSPTESNGIVSLLGKAVETELSLQRTKILGEFSLDQPNSALSRLVTEVEKKSGQLGTDLKSQIELAVGELSLDKEGSALHRLRAQLLKVIDEQNTLNTKFQGDVRATLERLAERKTEAALSTRHGLAFEENVGTFVIEVAQRAGDVAIPTGAETGLVRASKKGDFVVEAGPEKAAAGAKIVVEAKEVAGYTLAQARAEIDEAKRNRGASVGVFVFSRLTAPEGMESLARIGDDVYVTWDAEDPSTDTWLRAGLTLASFLVWKVASRTDVSRKDLEALDKAVNEVERQSRELDQIRIAAETVQTGSTKILERVRIARAALERQVEALRQGIQEMERENGS